MSGPPESFTERQENELQLLEAIYVHDVTDLRTKDAWKVHRPPELEIRLRPQESMHARECYVSLSLVLKCPSDYPDQIPELRLENVKGLSTRQTEELLHELRALAESLTGEVMILELCQHAQEFLHKHNKPPKSSFYEEMVANQREVAERRAEEKRRQAQLLRQTEQQQLEAVEKELQKRKEEAKKRKGAAQEEERDWEQKTSILKNRDKSDVTTDISRRRSGSRTSRNNSQTEEVEQCATHSGTASCQFKDKHVLRGCCLGHSARGSTVYACMDEKSGALMALTEWVIRWRIAAKKSQKDAMEEDDKELQKFLSQVRSVESEFNLCIKLSHKHLLRYHAMQCVQETGKLIVNVLTDYAGGGSLVQYLKRHQPVAMVILQQYTSQILDALAYLHSKSVAHKDLRFSSLLLDGAGNIQLADYSINKRLSEIVSKADFSRRGVHFEDADVLPTIGKGVKKSDIFRLGIVLLSLAEGSVVQDPLAELPDHLPPEFRDFVKKCLIQDERTRWSAEQLLEHTFVKLPLPPLILQTQDTAKQGNMQPDKAENDEEAETEDIPFIPSSDSGSRLQNEFQILKSLGKGAFGDVIKVRNKLDQRLYAIKRIPLNPYRKHLTRKITREVKLLSRLNHENVVRYYNSWIETSDEPAQSDSSASASMAQDSGSSRAKTQAVCFKASFAPGLHDIEKFAPPPVSGSTVEWSSSPNDDVSDDDFDDDADFCDDVFGALFPFSMQDSDDDDGVVFEGEVEASAWDKSKENGAVRDERGGSDMVTSQSSDMAVPRLQFLYIQMEFCEKSTLRTCIDMGLSEDMKRVWRLFREIIEGLVHIHEQGMIHRDLKPVNIFLDSNDQVKIGDFGLATVGILKPTENIVDFSHNASASMDSHRASGSEGALTGEGGLTGQVGTALYVSPEIMDGTKKLQYSQKVDVYSLGMIFFEMCYRPLDTGMERIHILGNLRKPSIDLPGDFEGVTMSKQVHILKWLLNHDPAQRPTSRELLQSDYLPVQEEELNEVLQSAIAKPEGRTYRRMLDALFNQPIQEPKSFLYDEDIHKVGLNQRTVAVSNAVSALLEGIFKKHGAVKVATPLLLPQSQLYALTDLCVRVMDQGGSVVSLPYDLRVPFARYVARRKVCSLRRYSIDKVYRENRWHGSHPHEITACSFDIVSPNAASFVPDAEVLHVVFDIIAEVPVLQSRGYRLCINHTDLLRAILLHCTVPENLHADVIAVLSDTKSEKQRKWHLRSRLTELDLSENTVSQLLTFMETDAPFGKVASMLRCITKTKSKAGTLAKAALNEMEQILSHCESLGCKVSPTLAPGLLYSVSHFRGAMFQVAMETRKRKRTQYDVLAAGGRYDCLIERFVRPGSAAVGQTAVGVNISFDKIVAAALEDKGFESDGKVDVYVCSLSHKTLLKEKLSVLKDLWAAGLCAQLLQHSWTAGLSTHHTSQATEDVNFQSLDDVYEYCRHRRVSHLVVLKDNELPDYARISSRDKDKFVDKKVPLSEVAEHLLKILSNSEASDVSQGGKSAAEVKVAPAEHNNVASMHQPSATCNINVVQQENTKLPKNTRRTYETQIHGAIHTALVHISHRSKVEVIAVELTAQVIKTIATSLEMNSGEAQFESSFQAIFEKHARHRKYLTRIFDLIRELHFERDGSCVILLYGLKDDCYRFLL